MEQIIETIKRIEKARTALRQAIVDNEIATSPKCKEIKVNDRKEFIFVVIYLYSPNKFFGGKMPQGLRRAITKATKVTCASVISATCTELMVLYTTYSDFRQNVDELIQKVNDVLE